MRGVTGGAWSAGTANSALYTAIKHVAGKAPCTPAALAALDGIDPAQNNNINANGAQNFGLTAPTDGLAGAWYVINVPDSTTFSGAANAIVSSTTPDAVLYSPQLAQPAALKSADPLLNSGLVAAQHYDVPDLSTPLLQADTAEVQAAALTKALAHTSVSNQYVTDATISAKTDWVFSMPTRRYMVAANYSAAVGAPYGVSAVSTAAPALLADGTGTVGAFDANVADASKAYRVFNQAVVDAVAPLKVFLFTEKAANSTVNADGQICATASTQVFFDREETSKKDGAVFSPGTTTKLAVCGEVSVVTFGATSVTGATVSKKTAAAPYTNGWGYVQFAQSVPVLGAAFQKGTNPSASQGMIGNYGVTWPHVYK